MLPADPHRPAPTPDDIDHAVDDADDDEATRIVRRGEPRHGAAAPAPTISSEPNVAEPSVAPDQLAEPSDGDEGEDDTVIVQRTDDEHTRIVARRSRAGSPLGAAEPEADGSEQAAASIDEATVRSPRGSTTPDTDHDTLFGTRRAAAPARIPMVDTLQRRYEPPQVQSGASVRYAARPTPAIVPPPVPRPVADVQPDLTRLRLADAAAEIRERAAVTKRRRRRLTLIAITSSTALVVLATAAVTVFTILNW
ncbi:hypothetical protein [Cryobacterium sp. PH31-O1]|uniref:hypothetical protein n=1 Tax=Cryobacterium sp. PH31-O1 TaxID=3046306 RepID=UPI0024B8960D|nr:hypothetical protein [Cryobacterium sp. PH31-O1]MDJ0337791.1 hypothetical protein [Cryobacterium sp. PH31-O1]